MHVGVESKFRRLSLLPPCLSLPWVTLVASALGTVKPLPPVVG